MHYILFFKHVDTRTLAEVQKAYFGVSIDVMQLKRLKLQLEVDNLNRQRSYLKPSSSTMQDKLASL